MGIHVSWADTSTVLIRFEPGWNWDNLYAAVGEADALIANAPHQVNMVIDIHKAGGIPRDFLNVAGDLLNQGGARSNEGEKIIVGANWLIRAAYQGFLAVHGHQVEDRPLRFAATMDEALAMLTT